MTEPHYVRDYRKFVEALKGSLPLDEAMSQAVGGNYEQTGEIERLVLEYAGLKRGMALADIGCGSGRLSGALGRAGFSGTYLGTDVVEDLLAYARPRSPKSFLFACHTELSVPVADSSLDMVCAFSVFTHLQHEESYIYLADMRRALKPGGTIVFSFLEFGTTHHWPAFAATVEQRRAGPLTHLTVFIERRAVEAWTEHLKLDLVEIIEGSDAPWDGPHLGQCTAILRKPA